MKILLVEDDENKRTQILRFLAEFRVAPQVRVARSLQSGLDALFDDAPDLILLDMTIPNYDAGPEESGGYMYKTGGWEFLRQMDRFDMQTPVIVVTQFEKFGDASDAMDLEELDRRLRSEHDGVYQGFVYYNAAIAGWKAELATRIEQTIGRNISGGSNAENSGS
jgi:CheY-like chemotaxis protein